MNAMHHPAGPEEDFLVAARSFLSLVERLEPAQWSTAGLGQWSVRDLVGHTSRAITTVETYLTEASRSASASAEATPPHVTVPDAESYFRTVFSTYTDHTAVAERGRLAALRLDDDPVAVIAADLGRTELLLVQQHPSATVSIGSLEMPLGQYLRTRTFELVVHGLDLASATSLPFEIPLPIIADVAALAARVAAFRGDGTDVIFALTGRAPLRASFSIF